VPIFESYSIGKPQAILQYRLRFASIVTSKSNPKLLPEIREFPFAMGIRRPKGVAIDLNGKSLTGECSLSHNFVCRRSLHRHTANRNYELLKLVDGHGLRCPGSSHAVDFLFSDGAV